MRTLQEIYEGESRIGKLAMCKCALEGIDPIDPFDGSYNYWMYWNYIVDMLAQESALNDWENEGGN